MGLEPVSWVLTDPPPPAVGVSVSARPTGRTRCLALGAWGDPVGTQRRRSGDAETRPITPLQVKPIAAFVKKVLSSKKRRDVVTTVLKWVVMVTTALLNAVTVVHHLG